MKPLKQLIPVRSEPGNEHTAEHDGLLIDVFKLIHMVQDFPRQEVKISDLMHQMEDLCWTDEHGKISPEFVVIILKEEGYGKATGRYPSLAEHINKIKNSDYSFPLIAYRGRIIDGMHRLAKAVLENQTSIRVIDLEEIPQEALMERKA